MQQHKRLMVGASGPTAFDVSSVASGGSTAMDGNDDFTSVSFGAADASRVLVLCLNSTRLTGGIDTVTIGGVSATELGEVLSASGRIGAAIYAADVPTGTTGTINVTSTDTGYDCAWRLFRVVGSGGAETLEGTDTANGNTNVEVSSYSADTALIYTHSSDSGQNDSGYPSWDGTDSVTDYATDPDTGEYGSAGFIMLTAGGTNDRVRCNITPSDNHSQVVISVS